MCICVSITHSNIHAISGSLENSGNAFLYTELRLLGARRGGSPGSVQHVDQTRSEAEVRKKYGGSMPRNVCKFEKKSGSGRKRCGRAGQGDGHRGSLSECAGNLDTTAMLFNDFVRQRQPSPCPPTLRGKKGCKEVIQLLRRNTGASITKGDRNIGGVMIIRLDLGAAEWFRIAR